DCRTWNIAKRIPCWTSSSPSSSTSERDQKLSRYRRWAAARPFHPCSTASASAPSTCERRAGTDRKLDQPYATNFTSLSRWPGLTLDVTVKRAWSASLSLLTSVSRGPRTTCSIAVATRSRLRLVEWISTAPRSLVADSSAVSGLSITSDARG